VNALYSNPEGILTMKKTIKMLRATLLVLLGLAFIGTAPALGQDVVLDFGGDITGRPNDEFTVRVSTSNLTAALDVRNYEFVINFDNSLVSIDPAGVVTGALSASGTFEKNIVGGNSLRIAYAQTAQMSGAGTLFSFTVKLGAPGSSASAITIASGLVGGGSLSVTPAFPKTISVTSTNQAINLPNFTGLVGNSYDLFITTTDLAALNVGSYELDFTYNSALITLNSVSTVGTISAAGTVEANLATPGAAKIAAAFTQPLPAGSNLLRLNVTLKAPTASTALSFTNTAFFNTSGAAVVLTGLAGELSIVTLTTTLWQRAASSSDRPSWFGADTERGLAYANGFVYVASRAGGTNIRVLDAATGADVATLSVAGVAGGTFVVNDVESTADGVVFAANMTTNASTSPFKVYMYANNAAEPVVAVNATLTDAVRLGDKFTVTGNYANGTAQIWAASSTAGIARIYVWSQNGSSFSATPVVINLSDNLTGSVASVGPTPDGSFWFNYNGSAVKKYSATGTLIGAVPTSLVGSGSNTMRHIGYDTDGNELVGTFAYGLTEDYARVIRVPGNNPAQASLVGTTPALRVNANGNGAGDIELRYNADNSAITLYVLGTGNGVGAYTTQQLSFAAPVANTNRAPVFTTALTARSITEGQAFSFTYVASDADGDALTYSIVSAPAGMTINASTGVLSFTPTTAQIGIHVVTVGVNDGKLLAPITTSASITVLIAPVNVTFDVYMGAASGFNHTTDRLYFSGSMIGWDQPGTNQAARLSQKTGNDLYTVTISVAPGSYNYKFFATTGSTPNWDRGEWPGDPNRSLSVAADTLVRIVFGVKPGENIALQDARKLIAGAPVQIQGIITTPDFGFSTAEFYMQDTNGGTKVRMPGQFGGNNPNTPFKSGSIVRINGVVGVRFNEFLIEPRTYTIVSDNNPLPNPVTISSVAQWSINSPLQGRRVRFENMKLTEASAWPTAVIASGSGFDAAMTGYFPGPFADTTFAIRIDRDESDFEATPRPLGAFNLTGVMGRFNAATQLFPFYLNELTTATSVDDKVDGALPAEFVLHANFPNPFNPTTNIRYELPLNSRVLLEVYNVMGQRVATLVDREMSAGTHTISFDASTLSSGTYLVRMQSGSFTRVQKMTLLK